MTGGISRHIRQNVVGYVALFFALSLGTAQAINGPLAGKNTVGSADIINQEVKTADIRQDAVKTSRIKDNHVRTADVRDDTLPGGGLTSIDLAADSVGSSEIIADGVGSSEIAAGAVGSSEVADNSLTNSDLGAESVHASEFGNATFTLGPAVNIANNTTVASTLDCPAGTRMLSGGPLVSGSGVGMVMTESHPNTPSQWRVEYWNISGAAQSFRIVVHCLLA